MSDAVLPLSGTSRYAVACGLPCLQVEGVQTNLSLGLRVTAIVLGALGIVVGALIASRAVPAFSQLHQAYGWTVLGIGGAFVVTAILVQQVSKIQADAALAIQRVWRGHRARVKGEHLPLALFKKGKGVIDQPNGFDGLPRPACGVNRAEIFLPSDCPIVLKNDGRSERRFTTMKQARALCAEQGYRHLVIPQARVYASCTIERRLPLWPLNPWNFKQQVGLYVENHDRFTSAVREFVGFLCRSDWHDITTHRSDPHLCERFTTPRYDNVTLYVEGKEGKLGLVDLKDFIPENPKDHDRWGVVKALYALCFFPLHFDEIVEEMKKFDPTIESHRGELEQTRAEMSRWMTLLYQNHAQHIQEKGISLQHPTSFPKATPERALAIRKAVARALMEAHTEEGVLKGFLGQSPGEKISTFLQGTFLTILEKMYAFVEASIAANMAKYSLQSISSKEILSLVRTQRWDDKDPQFEAFSDSLKPLLRELNLTEDQQKALIKLLSHEILLQFATGKEMAYYYLDIMGNRICFY